MAKSNAEKLAEEVDRHLRPHLYYDGLKARAVTPNDIPRLEHDLATTFCAMQRSTDAGERQRQWLECLRLAKEIDKLNETST